MLLYITQHLEVNIKILEKPKQQDILSDFLVQTMSLYCGYACNQSFSSSCSHLEYAHHLQHQ